MQRLYQSVTAVLSPQKRTPHTTEPHAMSVGAETTTELPPSAGRVFFQPAPGVGCAVSGPMAREDPVHKKQGKVTVKYDRKELRKRLILEEWIIEQLSELYDCEVRGEPLSLKCNLYLSSCPTVLYIEHPYWCYRISQCHCSGLCKQIGFF